MSKCMACNKRDTKGSLCEECELKFKEDYKKATNEDLDFNIGETLYTTKYKNSSRTQISVIVAVIYKGPTSWIIRNWENYGVSFLEKRKSSNYGFLQCTEIDKKSVIYRRPIELYKTYEACYNANRNKFINDTINLKRKAILELARQKLDEMLKTQNNEILEDEQYIMTYIIKPSFNELTFREEQYQQIRNEIRKSIIENELPDIRNEIVRDVYIDIKYNFDKFFDKYIKNNKK